MATVKKQGAGYKITVSMGYDRYGKQIRRHKTWVPPQGMTPRQTAKELRRQEILFEEQCKTQQVQGGNIKLVDFAQLWFQHYAEKQLKPHTVAGYRLLFRRVDDALGHIRLDRLQPRQILAFYDSLEKTEIRQDTKYAPAVPLGPLLREMGVTQLSLSQRAKLSIGTVEVAVQGHNINLSSAQAISEALQLPLEKLFHPVERGPLSGKTRLQYHRFLSSMMKTAVQWQYIPVNPCAQVAPPKAEQKETAYLDEHQTAQLIAALEEEPILYRTIVLLLLNTGLRRGELCGLEWQDIDLDQAVLSVRRNAAYLPGRGVYADTPKTKQSVRSLKIPPHCIPLLLQYESWQTNQRLEMGEHWKGSTRLFTTPSGAPIHPDALTNWFGRFVKRHQLPYITLHGLRHTNATLLIAAGTNLRTVSSRLGHAQTSITANIYTHAIQSADAAAAMALDNLLAPGGICAI